jgi:hypothetical protein
MKNPAPLWGAVSTGRESSGGHRVMPQCFAPTDQAFKKLPTGALDALLKDTTKLKAVLSYHLIPGHVMSRDLKSGEVMTVQGTALSAAVSSTEARVNGAHVRQRDIAASNGVIQTSTWSPCRRTGNYWPLPPSWTSTRGTPKGPIRCLSLIRHPNRRRTKRDLLPIPVDNPVHKQFLVTGMQSLINRLPRSAAFLTIQALLRLLLELADVAAVQSTRFLIEDCRYCLS